jgi:hypothetical protein
MRSIRKRISARVTVLDIQRIDLLGRYERRMLVSSSQPVKA